MYYEICVSLNGRHLFATHQRSLTDIQKAHDLCLLLRQRFSSEDGYAITLTEYRLAGQPLNLDEVGAQLAFSRRGGDDI